MSTNLNLHGTINVQFEDYKQWFRPQTISRAYTFYIYAMP
jgi:hypothetical protein